MHTAIGIHARTLIDNLDAFFNEVQTIGIENTFWSDVDCATILVFVRIYIFDSSI